MCCKEFGHVATECYKDPNLREQYDIDEEEDRLVNMLDTKRLNGDA